MRIALNIVAGLSFLLGAVWFLQGISVLPRVPVAAGIGLFLLANRMLRGLDRENRKV
jgi:small neutral amino acid transporter SnatA (MarC family)